MESPFTFALAEEVHAVRERWSRTLEQMLREQGWDCSDGPTSDSSISSRRRPSARPTICKKVRMWLWEGDPLAETFLKTVGVSRCRCRSPTS